MPALRALKLMKVPNVELLFSFITDAVPQLRSLAVEGNELSSGLTPEGARAIAAMAWPLEELDLRSNCDLGSAGLEALLSAPTFALRSLTLYDCNLDATCLPGLAGAAWPLEELALGKNKFGSKAGPALAALSRHARLLRLNVDSCGFGAAGFKALVEATWPVLIQFTAMDAKMKFDGRHALGDAAFAGFPVLEELRLAFSTFSTHGARLLASRRWVHLRRLHLTFCQIGDEGVAALARG